jgi:hypothetical protein
LYGNELGVDKDALAGQWAKIDCGDTSIDSIAQQQLLGRHATFGRSTTGLAD